MRHKTFGFRAVWLSDCIAIKNRVQKSPNALAEKIPTFRYFEVEFTYYLFVILDILRKNTLVYPSKPLAYQHRIIRKVLPHFGE